MLMQRLKAELLEHANLSEAQLIEKTEYVPTLEKELQVSFDFAKYVSL